MGEYEKKSDPVRELIQSPSLDKISEHLTQSTEGMHEIAPHITQALKTTASRAMNYLHTQMPKPLQHLAGDDEYEPSETEKEHWLELHSLVSAPSKALDHVRHGTFTKEHANLLNEVHPELYQEMKRKVIEEMSPKRLQKLSTGTKMALSEFLGEPLSSDILPTSILNNQRVLQKKMLTQQRIMGKSQNQKSPLGGLKSLDLGKRASTETQNLEDDQV